MSTNPLNIMNADVRHHMRLKCFQVNMSKHLEDELFMCVITLFYGIMYYNIRNTFWTNLPVHFYPFVLCTYIYICLLCIVICMHSFIQHIYLKYAIV